MLMISSDENGTPHEVTSDGFASLVKQSRD
jgi:hypothetical protein